MRETLLSDETRCEDSASVRRVARMLPLGTLGLLFSLLLSCAPPGGSASPGSNPSPPSTAAVPVADFYGGNTVTIVVGFSPGGGYDTYARLLSRHLGSHLPGSPAVAVRNVEGGGSMLAANQLVNTEPNDGTVVAMLARALPLEQLIGSPAVQYDARTMNWVGSMNSEVSLCIARADAPVRTFDDLRTTRLRVGGIGPASDTDHFPRILNAVLGTQLEIITGYPGGNEINDAVERNEVQGRCGLSWSTVQGTRPNWVQEPSAVRFLVQLASAKHPDVPPSIPLIFDFARTQEERQVLVAAFSGQATGRPLVMGPNVPTDRVLAVRNAFMAAMQDPAFRQDAAQQRLEINPLSGEEIQGLVETIFQMPPDQVARLAQLLRVDS